MTMCVRKLQIIECFYRFKRIQCKVQLILNKTILELVIDYVKTINKLIICVIANLLCLSIINLLHFIFILCNPVLLKGKTIYLLLYNIKKVLSRHSQVFKLKIIFTFSSKTWNINKRRGKQRRDGRRRNCKLPFTNSNNFDSHIVSTLPHHSWHHYNIGFLWKITGN